MGRHAPTWYAGVLALVVLLAATQWHANASSVLSLLLRYAPQRRAPAQELLTPGQIAHRVGIAYGDAHAWAIFARPDQTEGPPFHPMFFMAVAGHFHEEAVQATILKFSALADRLYLWGIEAFAGGKLVWSDDQWPAP